ncbi:NUDIX domain-containing protein [Halosimplex salinum]|uniref:NUDIX domain-containing protein n=1 Tax=Halosimplex salinum TaxID=1710538 RepID=UPI0013DDA227|nr:NUDIX domain-containing protein [Halosimplex salinum]
MVNYPPEYCPYCGGELELVEGPTVYRCDDCDDWVFHNAVLGGGAVVVDDERILLVEDFRGPGTWKIPEGVPEIPESPREGVARELEEETNLTVDPADLVYLYDVGKEVDEDMFRMHVCYAVDRSETTGPLEAGDDATDARFWTPEEFEASDNVLRDMPNPEETRSWDIGLDLLRDQAKEALERETSYADLFEPHIRK